jgi:hypothetical protein
VRAADHERGRRSRGVGVANPVMRLGFSATPWLYDALVGPLMRVAGLRRQRIAPHPGNVFAPSQEQVSQQQVLQK